MELKGAVAAITGASRGLGRQLALALAREGCHLRVCARDENALRSLQEEAKKLGVSCEIFPLDLMAGWTSFEHLVGTAEIDILLNNASVAHPLKPVQAITPEEWFRAGWLNVYVPFRHMQAVIPGMKNRGRGAIVSICSMAGRRGIRNLSLYSATKFALRGFTEAVAQELEGTGACCFSCSPGGMNTLMRSDSFGIEDAQRQQEPQVVAAHIVNALAGRLEVPNGADLVVRHGNAWVILPELWELGEIIPAIRRVVRYKAWMSV
jgi:3-oxoacyl-[acyl-carrier protein] reductase